jgi:hypothetical protein
VAKFLVRDNIEGGPEYLPLEQAPIEVINHLIQMGDLEGVEAFYKKIGVSPDEALRVSLEEATKNVEEILAKRYPKKSEEVE